MDADSPSLPPNHKKTPTSHPLISRKTLRVKGPSRDAKAKVIHVPLCSSLDIQITSWPQTDPPS